MVYGVEDFKGHVSMIHPYPKPRRSRERYAYRTMPDGREICNKTALGRAEYRKRTLAMAERQGWRCELCGLAMTPDTVTFDHQQGRGMGGGKRDDRMELNGLRFNAAVHGICNADKASRIVPYVAQ